MERLAHGRLFLPKTAMHLSKQAAAADFVGVLEIRGRGIRILGGTVPDDEQGSIGFRGDGHGGGGGRGRLSVIGYR